MWQRSSLYITPVGNFADHIVRFAESKGFMDPAGISGLKTAERSTASLTLRSHSGPSPVSTSGSERTQLGRISDLTELCSDSSGSLSFLSPYLATDDNVSSLSPHVMLITHI